MVLDYIVETTGGLICLVTNVSGTLYQYKAVTNIAPNYIAMCFMGFMYAVPIPLSYLINESRVRDTIIADGWIDGIKSIFYSPEKIRNLEREKTENSPIRSQNNIGKNNPPSSLPKCQIERKAETIFNNNSINNHTSHQKIDNDKSPTTDIILRQDMSSEELKSMCKTSKMYTDSSDEHIIENLPNRDMSQCASNLNVEPKEDEIVVVDIEYVNEQMIPPKETDATEP